MRDFAGGRLRFCEGGDSSDSYLVEMVFHSGSSASAVSNPLLGETYHQSDAAKLVWQTAALLSVPVLPTV